MTSKLDAHRKARDHRRNDKERKKRKRHHERDPLPVHVDVTSIVFASQQPDAESRYIFLEVLPDMTEEWIDKIVFVRSPTTGTPDRSFLGIQNLDDSLVWIELSLAAAAAPGTGGDPDPADEVATFVRRFGAGSLGTMASDVNVGIDTDGGTNLWVSDPGNDRAAKFSIATGLFVSGTTGTAPTQASGLVYNPADSRIYVVDRVTGNGRVRTYNASTGAFVANIRNDPEWEGQFELLDGIGMNAAGTQFTVALSRGSGSFPNDFGRIHRVTVATGAIANEYSDTDYYPFPLDVDYDATGNLYVVSPGGSSEFTEGHRLTKLNGTTGAVINSVGGFAGTANAKFNEPQGVRVDRTTGRVFVADTQNHRVQIFDSDLTYLGKFGTGPGNADGELKYPSGMVLVGTSLYVVSNGGSPVSPNISEWTITL